MDPSDAQRARIDEMIRWLESAPRDSAAAERAAAAWGISERQARDYVTAAWREIRVRRAEVRPFDFERMEALKFDILRRAREGHARLCELAKGADLSTAARLMTAAARFLAVELGAADHLAKMHGVYAPAQWVAATSVDPAALTSSQRQARIAELLAKARPTEITH